MLFLVGVDRSPGGTAALRWANDIGQAIGASLCAVTAWEYSPMVPLTGGSQPSPENMDKAAQASLDGLVADELGEAAVVETVVGRGPAAHVLLHEAARRSPALVVVGTRGLGGVQRRVLGSVSRRVVELAGCPVAVIPDDGAVPVHPPVVVLGIDGSTAAWAALEWVADLASQLGAEVVVAHAIHTLTMSETSIRVPPDEIRHAAVTLLQEAERRLDELGVRHRSILELGDPRRSLRDVAAAERAAMMVVGARGVGPIAELIVGSVASYLVTHAERPVVVVRGAGVRP
jgi:nucleotide-binding universal stress UspA family protein